MMLAGPWITRAFNEWIRRGGRCIVPGSAGNPLATSFPAVLVIGYLCGTTAIVMLLCMLRFLRRLERGEVFTEANVTELRRIGWCCGAGALLGLILGVFIYILFLIVAGAAGFMMLIVRIVKNAFEQALRMKDELDYTV